MNREKSGLVTTTLELVKYEEKQGHRTMVKEPNGGLIYGRRIDPDVHVIHHQIDPNTYHDGKPKFLIHHGEPISSMGNGISMKAIVEMAPMLAAGICFRTEEYSIWNTIQPGNTYLLPKGIDLEKFCPLEGVTERLSGEPAVLYYENIRGSRNPLYWIMAMAIVRKKYPGARLHLYNIEDKRMLDTIQALSAHCHFWTFIKSIQGPVKPDEINLSLNRVDIVVSGLYPLYARSIEAFGAGKAFISPGYREHDYPWTCEYKVESMADAIIKCHENYDKINYRKWAEEHHDVNETVKQAVEIYRKYL